MQREAKETLKDWSSARIRKKRGGAKLSWKQRESATKLKAEVRKSEVGNNRPKRRKPLSKLPEKRQKSLDASAPSWCRRRREKAADVVSNPPSKPKTPLKTSAKKQVKFSVCRRKAGEIFEKQKARSKTAKNARRLWLRRRLGRGRDSAEKPCGKQKVGLRKILCAATTEFHGGGQVGVFSRDQHIGCLIPICQRGRYKSGEQLIFFKRAGRIDSQRWAFKSEAEKINLSATLKNASARASGFSRLLRRDDETIFESENR